MRLMLKRSLFLLSLLALKVVAQSCNATVPCEVGCCNESGMCGLGPNCEPRSHTTLYHLYQSLTIVYTDCHDSICISDCDRKSECDPGGFTLQFAEARFCPLNACCSKWGSCGITKEVKLFPRATCTSSKPSLTQISSAATTGQQSQPAVGLSDCP